MKFTNYSIHFSEVERARLQRIADQTGRTPASVLRRLLDLAELPEGRRLLGAAVSDPNQVGDPQPQEALT